MMIQTKKAAAFISIMLIVITLSPVVMNWVEDRVDEFPFSYYPMFSLKRSEVYIQDHLIGYDADEEQYIIPCSYYKPVMFNTARRQINKYVDLGMADTLAVMVAENIASDPSGEMDHIVRVEVVKGTFHIDNFFRHNDRTPLEAVVEGRAVVKRLNTKNENNY
jgi:hypothetical protein